MNHGLLWLMIVTIDDHRFAFGMSGVVMVIGWALLRFTDEVRQGPLALRRFLVMTYFIGCVQSALALWVPEAHRLDEVVKHEGRAR